MTAEHFDLELFGGSVERRYRAMRPEVAEMPWGTLKISEIPDDARLAARTAWTGAAFQEFRTGAACAATLRSLIEARAPVDLIALASRFPLDEMVHVELCARVAAELGGATQILYDPSALVAPIGDGDLPLLRASKQVVAFFCVGEALSIPLLHATARACTQPLTQQVLDRIVRDEADHGTFGSNYLDWALPHHDDAEREQLRATAEWAIRGVQANWDAIRARREHADTYAHDLGWMHSADYLEHAERALQRQVIEPLRARGIEVAVGVAAAAGASGRATAVAVGRDTGVADSGGA